MTALCVLPLVVLGPAGAGAVANGAADGDKHPSVALIGAYTSTGTRFRCTATLVTPRVLLTAAHCASAVGKIAVSFDSVIAQAAPSPLLAAADPRIGYTAAELAATGWRSGTGVPHPGFTGRSDQPTNSWNDVGVVILDQPVFSITPAKVAWKGMLTWFGARLLAKTHVTVVGFGTDFAVTPASEGQQVPIEYPILRRSATERGDRLDGQLLVTDVGTSGRLGAMCYGDSGGPVFLGNYLVAVFSAGDPAGCVNNNRHQRVEVGSIQNWLAKYGVQPRF